MNQVRFFPTSIFQLKKAQRALDEYKTVVSDQVDKMKDLIHQFTLVQEQSVIAEANFKFQMAAQREIVASCEGLFFNRVPRIN